MKSKPASIRAIATWIGSSNREALAASAKEVGRAGGTDRTPTYDMQSVLRHRFKVLGDLAGGRSTEMEVVEDESKINPAIENALLAREKRKKVRLENAEKEGELINGEEVAQKWQHIIYACKTRFLAIGARLAPVLPVKTDPHEIKEMIDAAVSEALEELET